MKITALDLDFLKSVAPLKFDAEIRANDFCVNNQDDACTLSHDDALKLLKIMKNFSMIYFDKDEYFAFTVISKPNSVGFDVSWCAISREPNSEGRYECASSFDKLEHMISVKN